MSLIDVLNKTINYYDDIDPKWRQVILDHKSYLIANSRTAIISSSYMQRYVHSLKRYLRSMNYSTNCAWIVGIINNIPSDVQFTSETLTLYIPNMSVIEELYTTYKTQANST